MWCSSSVARVPSSRASSPMSPYGRSVPAATPHPSRRRKCTPSYGPVSARGMLELRRPCASFTGAASRPVTQANCLRCLTSMAASSAVPRSRPTSSWPSWLRRAPPTGRTDATFDLDLCAGVFRVRDHRTGAPPARQGRRGGRGLRRWCVRDGVWRARRDDGAVTRHRSVRSDLHGQQPGTRIHGHEEQRGAAEHLARGGGPNTPEATGCGTGIRYVGASGSGGTTTGFCTGECTGASGSAAAEVSPSSDAVQLTPLEKMFAHVVELVDTLA